MVWLQYGYKSAILFPTHTKTTLSLTVSCTYWVLSFFEYLLPCSTLSSVVSLNFRNFPSAITLTLKVRKIKMLQYKYFLINERLIIYNILDLSVCLLFIFIIFINPFRLPLSFNAICVRLDMFCLKVENYESFV